MEMVHFIPPSQRRIAMIAAQGDQSPVLITGTSGTGKGAISRWIHQNGPRSLRPYIVATRQEPFSRQLPQAQGGSLVINEIGEWPLGEQKAILEFLKTRSIPHPEQAASETESDTTMRMLLNVRLIVTTSQGLEGRAQGGLFNAELLKRLSVYRIDMPKLSHRGEEFADIADGILKEICKELHKEHVRGITPAALQALQAYDWPGNLRELRNVLRMSVVSTQTDAIEATDLPDLTQDRVDFLATREAFEKIYITELLKASEWKIDRVTKTSQISKNVLMEKIRKLGIELPQAES